LAGGAAVSAQELHRTVVTQSRRLPDTLDLFRRAPAHEHEGDTMNAPLALWLALAGGLAPRTDTAVFAGGFFWGIEGVFEHMKGVVSATAGYAGGHSESPSYEEVSSGETGHAEAVRVVYDPSQVTYAQLLT